jgi:hypothetical protein
MSPGTTTTGHILEQMILPALARGGYTVQTQVDVGKRPSGRRHRIDILAQDRRGRRFLISAKWQQVSGTAEEKVPYEIICLAEIMASGDYARAYLVLDGQGWTLRDFFIGGDLRRHLQHADQVSVLSLETFVARANQGRL